MVTWRAISAGPAEHEEEAREVRGRHGGGVGLGGEGGGGEGAHDVGGGALGVGVQRVQGRQGLLGGGEPAAAGQGRPR